MKEVRERIRAMTAPRHRLPEAVQPIVEEVNRVLRGWGHTSGSATRLASSRR